MNIKYWRLHKLALATTPLVAISIGIIWLSHRPPHKITISANVVRQQIKADAISKVEVPTQALAYTAASIQTEYVAPTPLPTVLPTVAPLLKPSSTFYGMASFYSIASSSTHTASGQYFNESALTVAHKSLPFGTKVKVTNLDNGKAVIATVNDRGPYIAGRIIDLSPAANTDINCNLCNIRLEVLN